MPVTARAGSMQLTAGAEGYKFAEGFFIQARSACGSPEIREDTVVHTWVFAAGIGYVLRAARLSATAHRNPVDD